MALKIKGKEKRNLKQLEQHYRLERELADSLRRSSRENRKHSYSVVYDKLFTSIPHHPQLLRKLDKETQSEHVTSQMKILKKFLKPHFTFLEIGAGDCSFIFEVARLVKQAYAIEISEIIAKGKERPKNFDLIFSNGCSIPLEGKSVNIVYSNQLMEHLHPDDAIEQLKNIFTVLVPGGIYICFTPNRLNGPHDISKFFDDTATGLHLKEYSNTELEKILKKAGFRKSKVLYFCANRVFLVPTFLIKWIENALNLFPRQVAKKIARWRYMKFILGVKMVGMK